MNQVDTRNNPEWKPPRAPSPTAVIVAILAVYMVLLILVFALRPRQ